MLFCVRFIFVDFSTSFAAEKKMVMRLLRNNGFVYFEKCESVFSIETVNQPLNDVLEMFILNKFTY